MVDLYRDPNGDLALSSTVKKGSQIYSFQVKEKDIPAAVEIHSLKKNTSELMSEASNITATRDHHNLSAEST